MMYLAPVIASSIVFIFSFKYFWHTLSISSLSGWDIIILANGSNPFLMASVALVFFFSLYGLYKSSTSTNLVAAIIVFLSSSVRRPFSSISLITSSFLLSRFTW